MKITAHLFFVLCCLSWNTGSAQQRVSSSQILSTALIDHKVTFQEDQIDYYQQHIKSLYFVDRASFRTRSSRFDWARQDYTGRLDVNGLGEIYRSKGLQKAELETERMQKDDIFHDVLFDRYAMLARYYSLEKEVAIRRKIKTVYEDKLRVLEQMAAYSSEADPIEIMKTDFEKDEMALKIRENEAGIDQIQQWFGRFFPGSDSLQIDTSGLISTETMLALLNGGLDTTNTNPGIREKEAKIAEIKAEYLLEEARQLQTLDYIQVRYGQRTETPLFYKFDVGVGITLPYSATRRVKKSELTIEQHAAENELTLYREQLQRLVAQNFRELQGLQSKRALLQQQMADSRNKYAPEKRTDLSKSGVRALLKFEELQLERQLTLADIDQSVTNRYLEILYLTGRLSEQPLLNYLRKDLERL